MPVLLGLLDEMIKYFTSVDNKSLIARIYGVFTINTTAYDPVSVILMQNTTHLVNRKYPKFTFDLKGSTIGRTAKIDDSEY